MCQRITDRDAYEAPETCDCPDCMPPGADGAIEAALAVAARRTGLRGRYVLRPLARTVAVSWGGDGSRTDVDREALREAAHALRRVGRTSTAGHELFVA